MLGVNHCFVEYQGRFYDSEAPEGVDDYRDLPFFKRVAKKRGYVSSKTMFPEFLDGPDWQREESTDIPLWSQL